MKRRLLVFFMVLAGAFFLYQLEPALAQGLTNDPLGVDYGQYTGLSDQDVRVSVALIIKFILSFLGIIFLILTLYAGFMWMTSAGNEDRVDKAKKILSASIIGIVIVFFSFAITEFVVTNLYEASTSQPYTAP